MADDTVPPPCSCAALTRPPGPAHDRWCLAWRDRVTPPPADDTCNCHHYGHARLCPVHTQADYDAAEQVREGADDTVRLTEVVEDKRLSTLLTEFYDSDDGDYVAVRGDILRYFDARLAAVRAEVEAERDEWRRRRDAAVEQCRYLHQDGKTREQWHLDNCGAMRALAERDAAILALADEYAQQAADEPYGGELWSTTERAVRALVGDSGARALADVKAKAAREALDEIERLIEGDAFPQPRHVPLRADNGYLSVTTLRHRLKEARDRADRQSGGE